MALCSNVTVYVIAQVSPVLLVCVYVLTQPQVFYAVGTDSANYILYVIMADVSSLRNRALAFGFSTTPYLLTAFAGPAIAQWFQENSTWRWAYATFAITTPLLSAPLALILFASKRKAYNEGLIRPARLQQKDVSTKHRLRRLAVEFDGPSSPPSLRIPTTNPNPQPSAPRSSPQASPSSSSPSACNRATTPAPTMAAAAPPFSRPPS